MIYRITLEPKVSWAIFVKKTQNSENGKKKKLKGDFQKLNVSRKLVGAKEIRKK